VYNQTVHNITARTAVTSGSETWVLNRRYKERMERGQTRFLRPLLRYTSTVLDHQRNVDIKELEKVQRIVEEIQTY
jgi:hypothetical protein